MSDIVLCTELSKNNIQDNCLIRENISMLPNPAQIFSADNQLYLYYELYNLKLNDQDQSEFEHNIVIAKVGDVEETGFFAEIYNSAADLLGLQDTKSISLSSEYQDTKSTSQVYLQLDLGELEPGDYKLSLSVTDNNSGQTTSNETMIYWR